MSATLASEDYERNEAQLALNSQAYAPERFSPPREGPALLQGLLICSRCGERMTVRYHQRGGKRIVPDYLCQHKSIEHGRAPCQRIPGSARDPSNWGTAAGARHPRSPCASRWRYKRSWSSAPTKRSACAISRSNARTMKRTWRSHRYLQVDPDNRLVARVLEAEWNTKLRELEEARALEEQYAQTDQQRVSAIERAQLGEVPERFRQFWQDPRTTARERKRAVRLPLRRCDRPQS